MIISSYKESNNDLASLEERAKIILLIVYVDGMVITETMQSGVEEIHYLIVQDKGPQEVLICSWY